MSSAFPNMIPSEPPPLDSLDDEEETEEEYYGNYTSTGLQLDVLAENSPMSSPRRTLPGGLTPTPSTPEKRQPNPNLTVNGTSDYPEIDNSQKDEVDIKQIKTPEPEPQQPVLPLNNVNHTPASLLKTAQYDSSSNSFDEEDQDDFGDFHSPELGNELSEANSNPELPNASNTSSCHSPESRSESVQIETNGLADSIPSVDAVVVPETSVEVAGKVDNPEELYFEIAEQRNTCEIPSAALKPVEPKDLEHFHTEDLEPSDSSHSITDEFGDEFGDFSNAIPIVQKNLSTAGCDEDEFGEFSSEHVLSQDIFLKNQSLPCSKSENDFEEFQSNVVLNPYISASSQGEAEDNADDDFGDFHCSNETEESRPPLSEPSIISDRPTLLLRTTFVGVHQNADNVGSRNPGLPASISQRNEESTDKGFGVVESAALEGFPTCSSSDLTFDTDFGDFKVPEQTYRPPIALTRRDSKIESKFSSMVASVFPQGNACQETNHSNFNAQTMRAIDKELDCKENPSWTHIQEFEDSHGLKFKWAQSSAHSHLLKSLKIDTCIVLRSQKWGTIEVPKFAASLGDVPLQPIAPMQPTIATMPSPVSMMAPVVPAQRPVSPVQQPVSSSPVFHDFQEFQSHKTAPSRDSVSTASTSGSSQVLSPQTSSLAKSTNMNEGSLSSMSPLSTLSYNRTQELVFPSTPMFHE